MRKPRFRQGKAVPFYKIHGAGNDCLVFEAKHLPAYAKRSTAAKSRFVRAISDRHMGMGSDQVLEVLSLKPLRIQIWNCDGSRAEMCANGSRSFASLALELGWVPKSAKNFPLGVSGKMYEAFRAGDVFELALGEPKIIGKAVLRESGEKIPCVKISVGNPHAVVFMLGMPGDWRAPKNFSYREWGPRLEVHKAFPAKANIEFVRKLKIRGRTADLSVEAWERGAGATLSCGSGAVAVARAVRDRFPGKELERFKIRMTRFTLNVRFEGGTAYLSGPTALVGKGVFYF